MQITSNLLLRQMLAPLLRKERLKRGLTPSQVAICCDLSADTIEQIERGERAAIRKYVHLMRHYGKDMKIELIDK